MSEGLEVVGENEIDVNVFLLVENIYWLLN